MSVIISLENMPMSMKWKRFICFVYFFLCDFFSNDGAIRLHCIIMELVYPCVLDVHVEVVADQYHTL